MNVKNNGEVSVKALVKAFNGDLDLVLFFLAYIKNGKVGYKTYQELHPGTDYGTAATLASRLLKKVEISAILEVYGAGFDSYFKQLSEGQQAMKWNDFTGEERPDHKTRGDYNKRIGKLLGIETDDPSTLVQVNVTPILGDTKLDINVSENERNQQNT